MATCDICKFWKRQNSSIGECSFMLHSEIKKGDNTTIEIDIEVSDDSGLILTITTGEKFGCIKHEKK